MNIKQIPLVIQGLLAAFLFGVSAPIAKFLLGEIDPILLAALLYLGAGGSLFIIRSVQRLGKGSEGDEAQIRKIDLPWLVGAVFFGGFAAPIVLLYSIRVTPAGTASLLLNFEGVSTTLIAAVLFREAIGRRVLVAIGLITLASIFLSTNLNSAWGLSLGALGILVACLLWGLDNNFTRNISAKDPLAIVTIKGLVAGSFSLFLALILGNPIPALWILLSALLMGSLSYGLSIVLFIYAMRGLGAARASALFGTAPLAGVLVSFLLFHETYNLAFILAASFMFIGTMFLINEEHSHVHVHPLMFHEHRHRHDDEHHVHSQSQHGHSQHGSHAETFARSHSHIHIHEALEHEHGHLPDIHHRHGHCSPPPAAL